MWPNKKILFKKIAHWFPLLKITFEYTKVGTTHFEIDVTMNVVEVIRNLRLLAQTVASMGALQNRNFV